MAPRMTQVVSIIILVASVAVPVYAQDDKAPGDDFVSSTVSAIFDKVNNYTSGDKSLFIKDYNKSDEASPDYSTDVLGRKMQEPVIRSSTKAASVKGE